VVAFCLIAAIPTTGVNFRLADLSPIHPQKIMQSKGEKFFSISIFYGVSHMAGIEREVVNTLGFERRNQRWLTA